MSSYNCSLWMLAARTDIPYMMHTIPHLVRMSNFPFTEVVLAIDTAPLSGDQVIATWYWYDGSTQRLL